MMFFDIKIFKFENFKLRWKCQNHPLFLVFSTELIYFLKNIEIGTEPPREIVAKFNHRKV